MHVAQVVGQIVSTVKEPGLSSHKPLILRRVNPATPLDAEGESYVAVDLVGVGNGEFVLVAMGSAARVSASTTECPTDAAVVAVVDSVVHEGEVTFSKS
jgi:ethanolamine utilization protein EutN